MTILHAGPTCGKTELCRRYRHYGDIVIDTDEVISSFDDSPEFRAGNPEAEVAAAYISGCRYDAFTGPGQPVLLVTNLWGEHVGRFAAAMQRSILYRLNALLSEHDKLKLGAKRGGDELKNLEESLQTWSESYRYGTRLRAACFREPMLVYALYDAYLKGGDIARAIDQVLSGLNLRFVGDSHQLRFGFRVLVYRESALEIAFLSHVRAYIAARRDITFSYKGTDASMIVHLDGDELEAREFIAHCQESHVHGIDETTASSWIRSIRRAESSGTFVKWLERGVYLSDVVERDAGREPIYRVVIRGKSAE